MTATDLQEWRSAVEHLDEAERTAACGHSSRGRHGVCTDCGDEPDP